MPSKAPLVAFNQYLKPVTANLPEGRPGGLIASAALRDDAFFDSGWFDAFGVDCPQTIRAAVVKRQSEYFVGRYLARQALTEAGLESFPLHADSEGCPQWPAGWRGSITHTDHYALCVIAPEPQRLALGVDAVDWLDLARAKRLTRKICQPRELQCLERSELDLNRAISLCFSAKESLYKAFYPHIQQWFGFDDAELVAVDEREQTLLFTLSDTLPGNPVVGRPVPVRFHAGDERGLTLVAL